MLVTLRNAHQSLVTLFSEKLHNKSTNTAKKIVQSIYLIKSAHTRIARNSSVNKAPTLQCDLYSQAMVIIKKEHIANDIHFQPTFHFDGIALQNFYIGPNKYGLNTANSMTLLIFFS